MQKVKFTCDQCYTEVFVKLSDEFDEVEIGFCPCCGSPKEADDYDDDEV